jgi:hypothetical protein
MPLRLVAQDLKNKQQTLDNAYLTIVYLHTIIIFEATKRKFITITYKFLKLKLSHFQFDLPKELLAEYPAENRRIFV